ncbi:hypothetical protein B0H13DRAFT_1907406 [Mycena leptocephala]|nr:hypothetical protein B0H13DRAFT_1907406 [Mycena leptocephala]
MKNLPASKTWEAVLKDKPKNLDERGSVALDSTRKTNALMAWCSICSRTADREEAPAKYDPRNAHRAFDFIDPTRRAGGRWPAPVPEGTMVIIELQMNLIRATSSKDEEDRATSILSISVSCKIMQRYRTHGHQHPENPFNDRNKAQLTANERHRGGGEEEGEAGWQADFRGVRKDYSRTDEHRSVVKELTVLKTPRPQKIARKDLNRLQLRVNESRTPAAEPEDESHSDSKHDQDGGRESEVGNASSDNDLDGEISMEEDNGDERPGGVHPKIVKVLDTAFDKMVKIGGDIGKPAYLEGH